MAEVLAAEEGPHKALLLPDTLDVILSHLDLESWKVARLVCRAWDDRALANVKDSRLRLANIDVPQLDSILNSVDPRLLTSLSLVFPKDVTDSEGRMRVLQGLFENLRASGNLGGLRGLKIFELDERSLDLIVEVANEGGFRSLKELALRVDFPEPAEEDDEEKRYKCKNLVNPNALPDLKTLCLISPADFNTQRDFTLLSTGPLTSALQSFVSASPNLTSLETNLTFDLSAREVRTLALTQCEILTALETTRMLTPVSGTLRSLTLCANFPQLQLPPLPALTTLTYCNCPRLSLEGANFDLATLPALQSLEADYDCINWTLLSSLLPPTGNLATLKVYEFLAPAPHELPGFRRRRPFALLLNSRLTLLSLAFKWPLTTSDLLWALEGVELEQREEGSRGVLEIHGVLDEDKRELHLSPSRAFQASFTQFDLGVEATETARRSRFIALLEKLGRTWGLLRLMDYKFLCKQPTWSEMKVKVPLFGGREEGLIRVVPIKNQRYTVELQIITKE